MALGSRLRLLTAKVTEEATQIYALYSVALVPKWFPVFFVLSQEGEKTISEIAAEISHSQPSVSKIIQEMVAAGLVEENLITSDKRRTLVGLTQKGTKLSEEIRIQYLDVDAAVENILSEATHNLWEAIAEWEFLLDQKSLLRRVQEQKKIRESKEIRIVAFGPQYQAAFKSLNEQWISRYFEMEETDYKTLNNPQENILDKGGKILVALYRDEPVGVCALIKRDDSQHDFELAKMAVAPKAQGKNIGWLLGQAIIKTARQCHASKLYLESNTVLKPAINLYYKLGFQKIAGHPTPYKRSNIQMELILNDDDSN